MPLSNEPWPVSNGRAIVFNTEAAFLYLRKPRYRKLVSGAETVYCDGVGLALYLKLRFGRAARRYHGPDVLRDYMAAASGKRILILGGSTSAQSSLKDLHPDFVGRNRVDFNDSKLAADNFHEIATKIARSEPDDVLIFLGLGRQEEFQNLLHRAGFAGSSIGLGAAIDFLSGEKLRAGTVWQTMGLEWLPRLMREPRMWPRVLRSTALFLCFLDPNNRSMKDWLFGGTQARSELA